MTNIIVITSGRKVYNTHRNLAMVNTKTGSFPKSPNNKRQTGRWGGSASFEIHTFCFILCFFFLCLCVFPPGLRCALSVCWVCALSLLLLQLFVQCFCMLVVLLELLEITWPVFVFNIAFLILVSRLPYSMRKHFFWSRCLLWAVDRRAWNLITSRCLLASLLVDVNCIFHVVLLLVIKFVFCRFVFVCNLSLVIAFRLPGFASYFAWVFYFLCPLCGVPLFLHSGLHFDLGSY